MTLTRRLPDSRRGFLPGDLVLVRYGMRGSQLGRVLGSTGRGKLVVRKCLANSGREVTVRITSDEIISLATEPTS